MITVSPINNDFVADISEVDITSLNDDSFAAIYQAWLDFGVLRIRNQPLDEAGLQQFSARFGPLEEAPLGLMSEADKHKLNSRYVTQLSNIIVDGKPIGGLGNADASWHSDMTYIETPPPASILLGIEIPTRGGETYFADQYAALAALPKPLRNRIQTLTVKHDAAHTSIGKLRPGFKAFADPREAPGAIHSMIRQHEETGRDALYLGRREWAYIPGLSLDESEGLLDELFSFVALPQNVWQQQWQPNDIIIWDNRRVMHRRDGFDQSERRLMKRCQVLSKLAAGV